MQVRRDLPVVNTVEGFFVGDVVHQDESHRAPVVGGGDGPVPLLTGRILWSKIPGIRFFFEIMLLMKTCMTRNMLLKGSASTVKGN